MVFVGRDVVVVAANSREDRKIVSNFNDPIDVVSWFIGHENNNKISLTDHESQSHVVKKRSKDSILWFTFLLNINGMQAQPEIKV